MPPLIDIKGKVFGKLFVRCRGEDAVRVSGAKSPRWWCLCNCGSMMPVLVEGGDLRGGRTVSCGCHDGFISGHKNEVHGRSHTPEYCTWLGIHRRCYYEKEKGYKSYGGRGIKVCERWNRENKDGLNNFIEDMGKRPCGSYSIERIDVNKGYCKENCTWIPRKDQCKNKTNSRRLVLWGKEMIQSDWAKILCVRPSKIQYHLLWAKRTFEETVSFICRKDQKAKNNIEIIFGGSNAVKI